MDHGAEQHGTSGTAGKVATAAVCGVAALAVIYAFHFLNWPLYEWSRPLAGVPVVIAGMHFRRSGSIFAAFVMVVAQLPVMMLQMSRGGTLGMNYFSGEIAISAAAVFLGHTLCREKEGRETIEQTKKMTDSIGGDSTEPELLRALEGLFLERARARLAEIYLFGADGLLYRDGAAGCAPLERGHLYYAVAESEKFFVSRHVPDDPRVACEGNPPGQLAVFPIEYGHRVRGVIAVADSGLQRFGPETVMMLTSVKNAVEKALELLEKRQSALDHELERVKIRDMFSSYVSSTVADEILRSPEGLGLGGTVRDVAVMFVEATNFEDVQAKLPPGESIALLNEFLSGAIETIFDSGGTVDKFIGCGVLAYWGAPVAMDNRELWAMECAARLVQECGRANEKRAAAGRPALDIRIGINSGPAVAGNIGSEQRMEYTIIGDTVNIASRLKSLAAKTGAPVMVSESARDATKRMFDFGEPVTASLKGKSSEMKVYPLIVESR